MDVSRKPNKGVLRGWYVGRWEDMASKKKADMTQDDDQEACHIIFKEFPGKLKCVIPLWRALWKILFSPVPGGVSFRTPEDEPHILYDAVIREHDKVTDEVIS